VKEQTGEPHRPVQTLFSFFDEVVQGIERTVWFNKWTLSYVKVNHGGGDIGMAKQLFQFLPVQYHRQLRLFFK
jgi:hypothetical protein